MALLSPQTEDPLFNTYALDLDIKETIISEAMFKGDAIVVQNDVMDMFVFGTMRGWQPLRWAIAMEQVHASGITAVAGHVDPSGVNGGLGLRWSDSFIIGKDAVPTWHYAQDARCLYEASHRNAIGFQITNIPAGANFAGKRVWMLIERVFQGTQLR